jgi:hypothetical protein
MTAIRLLTRNGQEILHWSEWVRPKQAYQWKSGRSAMELARAWFTSNVPIVPNEFMSLLNSSPLTKGIVVTEGRPEHVTPLPEPGGHRNHDLALVGSVAGRPVTVCVEAKADEPFGEKIGHYWRAKTKPDGTPLEHTRAPARIATLLEIVFGPEADPLEQPWSELRYQLLTGAAGTALQAIRDGSELAVFVIHEFLTDTVDRSIAVPANAASFTAFVSTLTGVSAEEVVTGQLYGPVMLRRSPHLARDILLFIGKVTTDWASEEGNNAWHY